MDLAPRAAHRTVAVLAAVAALLGLTVASPPPAAAAGGWYTFDANGDGAWETAVWYDAWNRPISLYSETNRDGRYDTYVQFTTGGVVDFAWFDTNFNSTWDTWADFRSDGYLHVVLSDAQVERDGRWDSLYYTGTGDSWYRQCGLSCDTYLAQIDTVYGMKWNDRSYDPFLLGAPSRLGENMLYNLAKATNLAGAMHCYNYRTSDYCRWFLGTG